MKAYIQKNSFNIIFYGGMVVVITLVICLGINNKEILSYYN